MKIAILGFGREGHSVLKFLERDSRYKNSEIWIVDKKSTIGLPLNVRSQTGSNYLKNLSDFDVIFRTPGIPYLTPQIQKARKKGVKISSATKLFFDEINKKSSVISHQSSVKIIGITGTKGKGTTATILYKILRAAGKKVFLGGNIGIPALDLLPKLNKKSVVILELSSFQLQDLKKSPPIAVVLDIFPDHLDAHKTLKEYYGAKANIARYQKPGDKIFFFSASGGKNSTLSKKIADFGKGKKIGVDEKTFRLFSPNDLKIKGFHNFKNAVMAAAVAKSLGVPDKIIREVAVNFRGNEHRLEFVRQICNPNLRIHPNATNKNNIRVNPPNNPRKSATIEFYNDSASTNPQTTIAAIMAFSNKRQETRDNKLSLLPVAGHRSLILIAGGQDKNLDYKPLARALMGSNTKLIILFGENKNKIARAIKKIGTRDQRPVIMCKNLNEAVRRAYDFAKNIPVTGRWSRVTIIFSPGATSFDMFEDYADRGEKFKKIVKGLK